MERHDAVVIGSGPNGLAAAITLARAGRSVLVLEAADRFGGAVATAELTKPGFAHDLFSAVHPAGAASPVFASMPLADHGLEWVEPPVALAHPLDDGRAAALVRDLGVTVDVLESLAPGDGRAWSELVSPWLAAGDALRRTLLGGFPPLLPGARLALELGLEQTLELARVALMPVRALGAELFTSPHARAWLYGTALHSDLAPSASGSAVFAVYLHVLGHLVGWPSPRGGAGALTDALVGHLCALGGQARVNRRVERIVSGRGRVAGVVTAGGERVRADIVVADVTPPALIALAGRAFDPGYRRKLGRFRFGPPTFKVDWALDGVVPWTAAPARSAGTVHVGGGPEELEQWRRELDAGVVSERPFVLFGQQSLADPSRAPAGHHTGWAYTHVPAGVDWEVHADREVDRVEAQIERFAPGFRDRIVGRHVMAPGELQRRNANLVDGDVGNGSYDVDQLLFRPVPSLSPYRTPVRGLYLGSAAAFPGAAVHGVAGAAAARAAVWESRLRW